MQRNSFAKGFMIVAGYSYNGKLKLRRVEKNAKINAKYYQDHILDPIYRVEIPALYGTATPNVWIHQDKAFSHTAKTTMKYMRDMEAESGIHVILYSSIPVKSPDASPMDYCGFGLLKRAIGSRRPRTVGGLWKACVEAN